MPLVTRSCISWAVRCLLVTSDIATCEPVGTCSVGAQDDLTALLQTSHFVTTVTDRKQQSKDHTPIVQSNSKEPKYLWNAKGVQPISLGELGSIADTKLQSQGTRDRAHIFPEDPQPLSSHMHKIGIVLVFGAMVLVWTWSLLRFISTKYEETQYEKFVRVGRLSCLVPVSVIATAVVCIVGSPMPTVNWSILDFLKYCALWQFLRCFSLTGQYLTGLFVCRRIIGMPFAEHQRITGPRMGWKSDDLTRLEEDHGERNIKILDASLRRMGHLVNNAMRCSVTWFIVVERPEFDMSFYFAWYLHMFVLNYITIRVFLGKDNLVSRLLIQWSRIRDGRYGRFNLEVVAAWSPLGKVAGLLILHYALGGWHRKQLLYLFLVGMQPLMWGDTAGEVIGSFFGRWEFNVVGFGDVNLKTVEGTAAVFLASLCSMYVVAMMFELPEIAKPMPLIVTSLLATMAEVASPRGTDNFFIVVVSVLSLAAFSVSI